MTRPEPPSEFDAVESYRMPLIDHLVELRDRMVRILIVSAIGCGACFAFAQPIWDMLVDPMNAALQESGRGTMAITEPLEGFITYLKVAALAGIGLASPFIFYQIWAFIAPGLYPSEKRTVLPLVFASTALFLGGASFGYFVIFDFAFPFFLDVTETLGDDIEAVLSINAYLGLATKLLIAFGVSFQLPIGIYFLARVGLVDHTDLFQSFRYAVVAMFVVSAIITPPDILSQCLMAGPLVILYGVGIVLAYFFSTKERDDDATPATDEDA
ncbi:MAG: twin-arginine translocase subunit TatC [Myxococcota bacterium]|nr:twin-arginine translocase subunit TatC [Myxococcota bacterium]